MLVSRETKWYVIGNEYTISSPHYVILSIFALILGPEHWVFFPFVLNAYWNGNGALWKFGSGHPALVGRPDAVLDRVVDLGVHNAPVKPQCVIALFFGPNVDIFGSQDSPLQLGEKGAYLLDVLDNPGLLLGPAPDEEPPDRIGLNLEVLSTGSGVDPDERKLGRRSCQRPGDYW